jgi:hypothetical protein
LIATALNVADPLGDYNHNGVVDAPDYVVRRTTSGQMAAGLAADGNVNGTVGRRTLVWRSQFGKPSGSGAGVSLSAAVPEPTAVGSPLIALVLVPMAAQSVESRARPLAVKIAGAAPVSVLRWLFDSQIGAR